MFNKQQQKTLATKAKLFEAAQRIFAKCGFGRALSIRSQRGQALGREAFYARFNNKEHLLFALVQERALEQLPQFRLPLQAGNEEQSPALIWELCKNQLRDSGWDQGKGG